MMLQSPQRASTLFVLMAIAMHSPSASAQSAWTQPDGGAFLQLSATRIGPYDTLYTSSGPDFRTGREITETSFELYGEYGIAEDWTLVGNLPLRSMDAGSLVASPTIQPATIQEDTLTSLGNVLIGVRKQLSAGELAWAAQLDAELPTSSSEESSGLSTGLDAFTIRPMISVGRGFERAYVQAYAGLSARTNDYSSDWRLGAEAGYYLTGDLLIAGTFDIVDSFRDGDVSLSSERLQTGLFLNDQEYISPGLKGLYQITDSFGLSASIRGALSGNNVPKTAFISFGLTYQI